MVRARRSDGPVIDIHRHRECAPAAAYMADAARAAGKVSLAVYSSGVSLGPQQE
jgi:aminocarboxymuconate-semialdehyde decarboxylase